MKQSKDIQVVSMIDTIEEDALRVLIVERLSVEVLVAVLMNFYNDGNGGHNKMVNELICRGSYTYAQKKLYLDLKNR